MANQFQNTLAVGMIVLGGQMLISSIVALQLYKKQDATGAPTVVPKDANYYFLLSNVFYGAILLGLAILLLAFKDMMDQDNMAVKLLILAAIIATIVYALANTIISMQVLTEKGGEPFKKDGMVLSYIVSWAMLIVASLIIFASYWKGGLPWSPSSSA